MLDKRQNKKLDEKKRVVSYKISKENNREKSIYKSADCCVCSYSLFLGNAHAGACLSIDGRGGCRHRDRCAGSIGCSGDG